MDVVKIHDEYSKDTAEYGLIERAFPSSWERGSKGYQSNGFGIREIYSFRGATEHPSRFTHHLIPYATAHSPIRHLHSDFSTNSNVFNLLPSSHILHHHVSLPFHHHPLRIFLYPFLITHHLSHTSHNL